MLKIVVISHALVQPAARTRWTQLVKRHPTDVTLIVPNHWGNTNFRSLTTWDPLKVQEGHYRVLPLPTSHSEEGTQYIIKSFDANLRYLQPDVIYVVQEETALVLQQMILYRRIWASQAKLVFFSWNNLGIHHNNGTYSRRWQLVRSNTDMAIAGNKDVKEVLLAAGYSKPITIQTEIGVDENVFRPDSEIRTQMRTQLNLHGFGIGFVGRITASKGLHDLLAAAKGLEGDWSLVFVGDGDLKPELETDYRDDSRIHFTGYIDLKHIQEFFPPLDCLVLPSRTVPGVKEQFGLVLAQAMASRVPVIGSDSGAIPEVIADAGMVFPEGDVNALRNCLQLLMNDNNLRDTLAQKGYERVVRKYSTSTLADETFNIFSKLVSNDLL